MNSDLLHSKIDAPSMSSLVEATGKDEHSASAVQTISGRGLNTGVLPKRPWSGYSLVNFTTKTTNSSNGHQRLIRSPKIRPKPNNMSTGTSTRPVTKRNLTESASLTGDDDSASISSKERQDDQRGLHTSVSLPTANHNLKIDNGTTANESYPEIDDLITMMKAHNVSDDNSIHGKYDLQPCRIPASFNFSFGDKPKSYPSNNASKSPSMIPSSSFSSSGNSTQTLPSFIPSSNFQFSFSANLIHDAVDITKHHTPRATTQPRRHSAIHTQHSARRLQRRVSDVPQSLSQTAYAVPVALEDHYHRRVANVQEEEQQQQESEHLMGNNQLKQGANVDLATRLPGNTFPESRFVHMQHRKILPLPTPRWRRKGASGVKRPVISEDNATTSSADLKQQQQHEDTPETHLPTQPQISPFRWQFESESNDLVLRYVPEPAEVDIWDMDKLLLSGTSVSSGSNQFSHLSSKDIGIDYEQIQGEINDVNYRDNAKKAKRSVANETAAAISDYEERKGASRRKDRKWRNPIEDKSMVSSSSSSSSSGVRFPEGTFDFSMDPPTEEKWKLLPKLEDLPRSTSSLGLTNVLRRTVPETRSLILPKSPTSIILTSDDMIKPNAADIAHEEESKPLATKSTSSNTARGKRAPNAHKKKKGKPPGAEKTEEDTEQIKRTGATAKSAQTTLAAATSSAGKRGKKANRKKKDEDQDTIPGGLLSSDVSLLQSADPYEWICLFCQYEIFCNGFEAARRKGGYHRRRRDRQRRLKEVEARRAPDTGSAITSDSEDERTHATADDKISDRQHRSLRRGNQAT
ncbi:hypothetical protein EC973_001695 [Apophysomyces ossiformis]|uniref:Uncharacterized protein n=1 Tax=Apophysomyces ossiformis TaxID=679940 RepID=A0A8H7EP62_9FUNG|nr:hypothetical protein EC973_001695 [Apophysomyces ossiformis]